MSATAQPALRPPRRSWSERAFDLLIWGGLAALLIAGFHGAEISRMGSLFSDSANIRQHGAEFLSPNFTDWRLYVANMWLTIQMALWGTAFAILIAVPLGLAGARNVSPIWIQQPVRRLMDVLRSVPDLVVGSIFIVAVGLGPFAGVMALAVNTGGVLGKLFSEAVEAIDQGPVEGIRATGAAPLQEIAWGVMPQVAPLWTSYALYRFEANARSATVLGLIGAGGIGQSLFDSINSFAYDQTSAIVIVIVAAVSAIDLLSQLIRTRLL
ncbi:MAG: phosphonate ABC transporter, permease protein PhnE [Caulobacteraceae bacterium]|nr:phosphonate ABC transporter, permease protein PhnE [Caulobacteraceae bacterium]